MRKNIAILSMLFSLPLSAQTVISADTASGQPTINRDADGFKSCGVRVVTGALSKDVSSEIYDFSLNVWEDATVLFKAGSYVVPFSQTTGWNVKNMRTKLPGPESFWIAKRDEAATLKPAKYVKSDDPGFLIGAPDSQGGIRMIWAIANGDPMQVALKYKSDHHERVVAFSLSMTEDEKAAILSCFDGLMARMKKNAPS